MKKFVFSFERVLNYKQTLLDREKSNLLRLRQAQQRMADRIKKADDDLVAVSAELYAKTEKGIPVEELKSYHFQIDNLRVLQKGYYRELRRLEDETELQLSKVVRLQGEIKGFEKLKEQKLEDYRDYITKADAEVISEFLSTQLAGKDESED